MSHRLSLVAFSCAIFVGCGGHPPVNPAPPSAVEAGNADAESAIATVRAGIEAIGGLERWRLLNGKLTYDADVVTPNEKIAVHTVRLDSQRYRFEYSNSHVTYVWGQDECRRLVYGVQTDCSEHERAWEEPLRILSALLFPTTDVAGLGITLRTKPSPGPGQKAVELRPNNDKLKLLAIYGPDDRLVSMSLALKSAQGQQWDWRFEFSDYREVDGLQVPFTKTISKNSQMIWKETISTLRLGEADERLFAAPMPPLMGRVFIGDLPGRTVRNLGSAPPVEVLVVPECPGGAAQEVASFQVTSKPAQRVLRIFHKGVVSELDAIMNRLKTEAEARKMKPSEEPSAQRLDESDDAESSGLYMLYLPTESR